MKWKGNNESKMENTNNHSVFTVDDVNSKIYMVSFVLPTIFLGIKQRGTLDMYSITQGAHATHIHHWKNVYYLQPTPPYNEQY
jgi:hypothetical protein